MRGWVTKVEEEHQESKVTCHMHIVSQEVASDSALFLRRVHLRRDNIRLREEGEPFANLKDNLPKWTVPAMDLSTEGS